VVVIPAAYVPCYLPAQSGERAGVEVNAATLATGPGKKIVAFGELFAPSLGLTPSVSASAVQNFPAILSSAFAQVNRGRADETSL
jgi:hypothetical protein